ncbi:MAG: catalase family protein [Desulfobulbus sp.]|jgi:hypothetical protein|nr:catalase family protein [Desulfobulbus sp.]
MGVENTAQLEGAQEQLQPDENIHAQKLVELLKGKMQKDYAAGEMLRGAHPKQHGCVKAVFTVEPQMPNELRVGLFKEARRYPAWIRFSNASGEVQADTKRDARGMAIKLMGVSGAKLLDDEKDAQTQDFILMSSPILPVGTAAEFHKLVDAAINGHLIRFFLNPFDAHLREIVLFARGAKHHTNPVDIQYWSTTPYLFGARAVKYSVRPTSSNFNTMPKNPSPNYLSEVMQQQLAKNGASFDFMVQFQSDPKQMPIEDASIIWDEKLAPFQKVATITIPPQTFNSEAQMDFGENLSFTPWHCLPEHRPLGSINRVRKEIYQDLSNFRHAHNGTLRQEPTGAESF